MILFVTTAFHHYTLSTIVPSRTGSDVARVVSYDWLFRCASLRASCVVFTDFDRLRHYELEEAARIYRRLRDGGIRVLNDPARARQRHDLLHALHGAGINPFRAYRAALRPRPEKFPVFLKCETDHAQAFDELIGNQDDLDRKLQAVEESGVPLRNMLVIEFANRSIRDGVYHRKTIYRIGERFLPGSLVIEDSPFVKYGRIEVAREEDFKTAADWIRNNPDAERFPKVFDLARIEYGRADYVTNADGLAVFEINTNPAIQARFPDQDADLLAIATQRLDELIDAIKALDGEDRTVRLKPGKRRFSGMRFRAGYVPKMP